MTPFRIPSQERDVPIEVARKAIDVSDDFGVLEGLAFDRTGDLWFVDCPHARVMRADVDASSCEVVFTIPDGGLPSAIKFHKDGSLYITCVASDHGPGIFVMSFTGELQEVIPVPNGRMVDDMVFASDGSIFYTDLAGSAANPSSGVYHISSDRMSTTTVMSGMIASNGIALSPDEHLLWVTEYGRGRLVCVELDGDLHAAPACGSWVPYHFCGLEGPDSMCADSAGNLYVALCGQARFLSLDEHAIPVRQWLLPEHDAGLMNKSTHPQLRPGTDELWLCASDTRTGHSALYVGHALADPLPTYGLR